MKRGSLTLHIHSLDYYGVRGRLWVPISWDIELRDAADNDCKRRAQAGLFKNEAIYTPATNFGATPFSPRAALCVRQCPDI